METEPSVTSTTTESTQPETATTVDGQEDATSTTLATGNGPTTTAQETPTTDSTTTTTLATGSDQTTTTTTTEELPPATTTTTLATGNDPAEEKTPTTTTTTTTVAAGNDLSPPEPPPAAIPSTETSTPPAPAPTPTTPAPTATPAISTDPPSTAIQISGCRVPWQEGIRCVVARGVNHPPGEYGAQATVGAWTCNIEMPELRNSQSFDYMICPPVETFTDAGVTTSYVPAANRRLYGLHQVQEFVEQLDDCQMETRLVNLPISVQAEDGTVSQVDMPAIEHILHCVLRQ